MSKVKELLKQNKRDELWKLCCGYIDLNIDQFMTIQKQLLTEQLELLKRSALGRKVMQGVIPETLEEFRENVPLTRYADYCPELLNKDESCLPAKPVQWAHTSGKSGEFPFKWVPISLRTWEEMELLMYAAFIFATTGKKGVVPDSPKNFLYATAPAPYTVGVLAYLCEQNFGWRYFPSPQESENMTFLERLDKGFWMALEEGIEGVYGLTAVLVAIGEKFKNGTGNVKMSSLMKRPRALIRLAKGMIKSKLARRPMLPRDVWHVKGMACGGTDSYIFREKIKEMWGVIPLDIYAGTEGLIVAMQTWDFGGMTFVPHLNFLEFIPESEYFKEKADPSYKPRTVLLDEVEEGQVYEIVLTNFHGGAMVRYRPGDMIKITALRNEKLGIEIPQMAFERRADDLIDLGIIRLNETVIWKALENTKIPYIDWTARKEVVDGRPALSLYIELNNFSASQGFIEKELYEHIKKLNDGFIHWDLPSMEKMINYRPVVVTKLSPGTFRKYAAKRQAEGADLAQLKPPHINPSDTVLNLLGAYSVTIEQETEAMAHEQKELVSKEQ